MSRILVTGGTGFIGSHLVRCLLSMGDEVHILARPASSVWRIQDLIPKLNVWHGDLTDEESIEGCIKSARPEVVFHLAGDTSGRRWRRNLAEMDASISVNLQGTLNLLKALNAAPDPPVRFIRAGGLAEYGDAPVPFDESARERPVSAYGAGQAATTMFLYAASGQFSFPVVTLRFAAVYGPGRNEEFFLPSLIVSCLEGRDFEMTAGEQPWDLIYIDDALDALLLAARLEIATGEVINIGTGRGPTLREIAELVVHKIGGAALLRVGVIPIVAGDIRELYCRNEKARELLGWSPQVDLNTGLDRTIEWYRQRLALKDGGNL